MLKDTVRIRFMSFASHQMGRGLVARPLSVTEREQGEYDPHPMFIHVESENDDPGVLAEVEKDCKDLARLLDKFGIVDDALSDLVLLQSGKPSAVQNNKNLLHMEYLTRGPWPPAVPE